MLPFGPDSGGLEASNNRAAADDILIAVEATAGKSPYLRLRSDLGPHPVYLYQHHGLRTEYIYADILQSSFP